MKKRLSMDKIAKVLRAERKGKVSPKAGYFGALQLLAEIELRFRVPDGGGRPTDPDWSERRLVPLAPRTLARLEKIATKMRKHGGVKLEPMQLAALLLEKTTDQISDVDAEKLVRSRRTSQ